MLRNIGCFLIGWDRNILNECGEASYRQYRKLLSAICIMMVLWGTIGYCFAGCIWATLGPRHRVRDSRQLGNMVQRKRYRMCNA